MTKTIPKVVNDRACMYAGTRVSLSQSSLLRADQPPDVCTKAKNYSSDILFFGEKEAKRFNSGSQASIYTETAK